MAVGYRTKQELIYQELHSGILSGRYRPGERLDIEEIAGRIGTSRTPVREAIRRLESEGLVTSVPHRGTVVSQLSLDEIAELYHIRAVLEGLAARLAAQNLTDEEAETLGEICEAMCDESIGKEYDRFLKLNSEFHGIINSAARAPLLYEYISTLYVNTSRYRRLTAMSPGRMEAIVEEHRRLADALIARDAAEAERIANLHHENNALALGRLNELFEELDDLI